MTAKRKTSEMAKDGNRAQLRNNVSFALHQLAKLGDDAPRDKMLDMLRDIHARKAHHTRVEVDRAVRKERATAIKSAGAQHRRSQKKAEAGDEAAKTHAEKQEKKLAVLHDHSAEEIASLLLKPKESKKLSAEQQAAFQRIMDAAPVREAIQKHREKMSADEAELEAELDRMLEEKKRVKKAKARGKPKRSKLERLRAENAAEDREGGGSDSGEGDFRGAGSDISLSDEEDPYAGMDMSMLVSDVSDDEDSDAGAERARALLLSVGNGEPKSKKAKKGAPAKPKKGSSRDPDALDTGLGKGLRMDRQLAGDSDDEDDQALQREWSGMRDDLKEELGKKPHPRRNRPGQRARQRIAEVKYGTEAKHVQNPELDANRRQRMQQEKEAREKRKAKYGKTPGAEHQGNKWSGERPDQGWDRRSGGGHARTGAGASANQGGEELHPSWAAKKRQAQVAVKAFEGTKVRFD